MARPDRLTEEAYFTIENGTISTDSRQCLSLSWKQLLLYCFSNTFCLSSKRILNFGWELCCLQETRSNVAESLLTDDRAYQFNFNLLQWQLIQFKMSYLKVVSLSVFLDLLFRCLFSFLGSILWDSLTLSENVQVYHKMAYVSCLALHLLTILGVGSVVVT